jgi:hypothetical protein
MHTPTGAVVVGFPLRGEGVAVRTPTGSPSHGTDRFGQRYAFNFVRPDDRKGPHLQPAGTLASSLLGRRTRDYYGWASTQPSTANVVAAVDRRPSGRRSRWCVSSRSP